MEMMTLSIIRILKETHKGQDSGSRVNPNTQSGGTSRGRAREVRSGRARQRPNLQRCLERRLQRRLCRQLALYFIACSSNVMVLYYNLVWWHGARVGRRRTCPDSTKSRPRLPDNWRFPLWQPVSSGTEYRLVFEE